MNTENLSKEMLRRYIPNVLTEVEGETPLVDKLSPFIDSAKIWIETEFLGPDDFLSDKHNDFALKIIVAKAFADALPSLDLVVTPSGIAVISTDSLAPASKERVERLIKSLRDYVRANICLLVEICKAYPEWRDSDRGRYFCSTFLSLTDCPDFQDTIYGTFDVMRGKCLVVEREMADRYLGHSLMSKIRADLNSGRLKSGSTLFGTLHATIIALLDKTGSAGGKWLFPDTMWNTCRPIIFELDSYAEYKSVWLAEMGDRFNSPGFVNDIKGGFYF